MDQEDSLDIDTSFDLQIAEWMMAERIARSSIGTECGS
jgi:CMP-N-acetylneuraminic acid synthetase